MQFIENNVVQVSGSQEESSRNFESKNVGEGARYTYSNLKSTRLIRAVYRNEDCVVISEPKVIVVKADPCESQDQAGVSLKSLEEINNVIIATISLNSESSCGQYSIGVHYVWYYTSGQFSGQLRISGGGGYLVAGDEFAFPIYPVCDGHPSYHVEVKVDYRLDIPDPRIIASTNFTFNYSVNEDRSCSIN